MGTTRIAAEVGPVGAIGIRPPRALPVIGLAALGDHRADALGLHVRRIGADKLLVDRNGIRPHRTGIGIVRAKLSDRLALDFNGLGRQGGHRRFRRRLHQNDRRRDPVEVIGCFRALAEIMHTHADALEHGVEIDARLAQRFGQRHRVVAIIGPRQLRGLIGALVIGNQHALAAFDGGKATTAFCHKLAEGVDVGGIEHHDPRRSRNTGKRAQEIADAQTLETEIAALAQPRPHGNENVLAIILHADAGNVDGDHRIGAGCRRLFLEIAERTAELGLREVRGFGKLEPGLTEALRDKARIL